MSVQIFLQGKLLGVEAFVLAPSGDGEPGSESLLAGRSHWVTLLSEILPRALLAELGLARILLGSSGGGTFLVVLPIEARQTAEAFLAAAAAHISTLSESHLRLVWAVTENLGDWSIVRKRLAEEMFRKQNTLPEAALPWNQGAEPASLPAPDHDYFSAYLAAKIRTAEFVGWSPDQPGKVLVGEGKHTWPVGAVADAIPLARHTALDDDGAAPADLATLAGRAEGRPVWGVLRGDVDNFGLRLRRVTSIEEHVQLSVLFKQFFAGELEVACCMADYWRKVTVLYSGGDDFAVFGSWDALLLLAREIQRLFHRFANEDLKELPGPEAKTISMSLALAPALDSPFAFVYEEAGRNLEVAKSSDKDCMHIFGRTIEWRQLTQAGEMKDTLLRMVREFGSPPELLGELSSFYRDKPALRESGKSRSDRPWRYHRRISVLLGPGRDREFQKIRTNLIADVIGRSPVQVKLRPAGRVAVEWTRLLIEA